MKKILVPVDFSPCSENALVYAIQLADKIKAKLLVLNVSTFETGAGGSPASLSVEIQDRITQSRIDITNFILKAKQNVSEPLDRSPIIKTSIEFGKIENTICQEAASNGIDYIVMGTHGVRSALGRYLGSIASTIVKNAPCSVMVIPGQAGFTKEMGLGYATDFSNTDPFEIWKAIKLFRPFQPEIKCIHFNEHQVDNVDKIETLTSNFEKITPEIDISFHSLPVKDKVKDMNDLIEKEEINMLVIYKPKRNFFESLFHKSYTQSVVMHTTIPLLVLKEVV